MSRLCIKDKIAQHLWKTPDGRTLRMGVGCAYFGKGEGNELKDLDNELRMMEKTYELGFRYYDTSNAYNEGRSEVAVGEFVKRIPRDSIFLATKSHYEWLTDKNAFATFKDNFYRSFEKLHTDYIDLFQIHDTNHYECCEKEVLPFLVEQRDKGLIGYIGTGMLSLNAHELAIRGGICDSVLSFMNYSLLTKAADPLIKLAKAHNRAFINASVLHFGLIKAENPREFYSWGSDELKYRGHWRRYQEQTARMQELCKKLGFNILAPAMQLSLLNPDIDITLNGINRMSNIDSTLAAVRQTIWPEQWAEIFRLQDESPYLYTQSDLYH